MATMSEAQSASGAETCLGLNAWLADHGLVGPLADNIRSIAVEHFADVVTDLLLLTTDEFESKLDLRGLRKVKFDKAMKTLGQSTAQIAEQMNTISEGPCVGLSSWLTTHGLVGEVAEKVRNIALEEGADMVSDLLLLGRKPSGLS